MAGSLTVTRDCTISGFGDVFVSTASLLSYILAALDIIRQGQEEEDAEEEPGYVEVTSDFDPLYSRSRVLFPTRYDVKIYPHKMVITKWLFV